MCACSVEACCGTHCVPAFAKKFCTVAGKSFKTKCNGFEVLNLSNTLSECFTGHVNWKKKGANFEKGKNDTVNDLLLQLGFKILFKS